ncbi:MAG: glucokinase [Gammaproteobacteria bacterium]|nr:glucokinase [Gammaproteobacteria bacterium]MDH5728737.1 glucokinase [Gammaproteobacteria bacterium]
MANNILLAADIGGTRSRLLLAKFNGKTFNTLKQQEYPSADFSNLGPVIQLFLADSPNPTRACFAIAGPVHTSADGEQTAQVTNLPWRIDSRELKAQLKIKQLCITNDFTAIAHSIALLEAKDLRVLQAGQKITPGMIAIIGAGTGLGCAYAYQDSDEINPFNSEGGHVDFAPTTEKQIELLHFLYKQHEHVSLERVLSGQGLENIYRFLGRQYDIIPKNMHAAKITEAATARQTLAMDSIRLFMQIYGASAGNMALNLLPTAGLYIAGGIAPRLLNWFNEGEFMQAFLAKGRMREELSRIPVTIICNTQSGLLGALNLASKL